MSEFRPQPASQLPNPREEDQSVETWAQGHMPEIPVPQVPGEFLWPILTQEQA